MKFSKNSAFHHHLQLFPSKYPFPIKTMGKIEVNNKEDLMPCKIPIEVEFHRVCPN